MILTILEVSQKQAFIFSSNKLRDNITNSDIIADALSEKYLEKILEGHPYSNEKNMVYSGGGHTVLQFETMEQARECTAVITETIYKKYNGLSVFATSMEYDENLPLKEGETEEKDPVPGRNMKALIQQLEAKKAIRSAAFRHGTFGIEKMSNPEPVEEETKSTEELEEMLAEAQKAYRQEKSFYPEEYEPIRKFAELGGSKDEKNFIAVVHIDGNGMGTRVGNLYRKAENNTWDKLKTEMYAFSKQIDDDFKDAFREMTEVVGKNLEMKKGLKDQLDLRGQNFPVRRIITAGDDICFVTEGRIGIECAVAFMEALAKKHNETDKEMYSSCAGVAIVHQKYPFYKAYELAEKLCSNAKKFNATIHKEDNGKCISSIDWHIEFGEIGDTLEDIRKNYIMPDGGKMELRPYIVTSEDQKVLETYPMNDYKNFRKLILNLKEKEKMYANGKIKEMRSAIKEGKEATKYYLAINSMEDILYEAKNKKELSIARLFSGKAEEKSAFVEGYDGKDHSILFDAIELIDTFLKLEKEEA